MPPALLWGAGTAIGEIPPYAFSYHAAKAGIRNEEWDNMFQVTPVAEGQGIIEALVNRMKNWMLRFIQKCALRILPSPALPHNSSLAPCCSTIVAQNAGVLPVSLLRSNREAVLSRELLFAGMASGASFCWLPGRTRCSTCAASAAGTF